MRLSPIRRVNKLVTEFLAKEAGTLAFMARAMVMVTLPHSKPDGFLFQRKNGHYTLTMLANLLVPRKQPRLRKTRMSKTDLVGNLLRERANKLSKVEKLILEIILITRIHQELSPVFSYPHEQYKRLIRSTHSQNQGENMKNISLIQEIIKDVLATKAYTLSGMATHTHIPTEVL